MAIQFLNKKTERFRFQTEDGDDASYVLIFGDEVDAPANATGNDPEAVTYRGREGTWTRPALTRNRSTEMYFLDVEQSDAAFIVTPNNTKILVDGGLRELALGFLIWKYRLDQDGNKVTIDHLVLSHADKDHVQGLIPLLQHPGIRVLNIYHNGIGLFDSGFNTPIGRRAGGRLHTLHSSTNDLDGLDLASGSQAVFADWIAEVDVSEATYQRLDRSMGVLDVGDPEITVEIVGPILEPDGSLRWLKEERSTIHGHSLTFRLTHGEVRTFFSGDLNKLGSDQLLKAPGGGLSTNAHIFKAPGLGSDYSANLFMAVNPMITILPSTAASLPGTARANFLGAIGRAGRGPEPLVLSTEVATLFVDQGDPDAVAHAGTETGLSDLDFADAGADREARQRFKKVLPGMVNVRTDGQTMYAFRRIQTAYQWESYGPIRPSHGGQSDEALTVPDDAPAGITEATVEGARAEPAGLGRSPAQDDRVSEVDHLGREQLVAALAAMLDHEQQGTPFTIALFGRWGAGKSSLMEQLQKRLAPSESADQLKHDFVFADFNAWRYEHTDNMAAGLVQETVRSLVDVSWFEKLRLRWGFAWREYRLRLVGALILFAATAIAAVYGIVSGIIGEELLNVLFGTGSAALFVLIGRVLLDMYRHPVSAELMTYFSLPQFGEHLGLWAVMERQLSTLAGLRLSRGKRSRRLVVLVDDLDRCSPEAVTQTFEAIRLVMDLPRVVVVLALDPNATLQAVAYEYRDQETETRSKEDIARDYLGKIIQLPIQLPKPDKTYVAGYIRDSLFPETREETEAEGVIPTSRPDASVPGGADVDSPSGGPGSVEDPADDLEVKPSELPNAVEEPSGPVEKERPAADEARPEEAASPRLPVADLQLTMKETRSEVDRFAAIAQGARFDNPRQLRRIRNCYRLLKVLRPGLPWERHQVMLFWQEFLYSRPIERHKAYESAAVEAVVANHDEAPEEDDEAPEEDDEAPEEDKEAPEEDKEAPEEDKEAFEFLVGEVRAQFASDPVGYQNHRSAVTGFILPRLY